ncbi:hypothetical protein DFH06DRAFT_1180050 [Mycena polygramma]|nr:hypothetical protein DFH06DRAFT_1180050 [Mycena polygramma]
MTGIFVYFWTIQRATNAVAPTLILSSSPLSPPPDPCPLLTMDASVQTDDALASQSTHDNAWPASTGMFSSSQNLTVTAGTMTNVTKIYNAASTVLSDFRSIRLGDIYLTELRSDEASFPCYSRAVYFARYHQRSFRRVYAARVEGRQFTVAMYQGNGSEEDWRDDISCYSTLRHPNFVQLWGTTTSPRIHAAVFHDDLIPFEEFVNRHRDSPVLVVYIYAYCYESWSRKFSSDSGSEFAPLFLFGLSRCEPLLLRILDTWLHWPALHGPPTEGHTHALLRGPQEDLGPKSPCA